MGEITEVAQQLGTLMAVAEDLPEYASQHPHDSSQLCKSHSSCLHGHCTQVDTHTGNTHTHKTVFYFSS